LKVSVRFFTTFRDAAGTSQDTVDVGGNTVGDVIDTLVIQYGDRLRQEIFQPDGNIKPSVKVLLNGSFVNTTAPLQDVVKEGDTLSFLPAMFGG
jgi:MoaD family protein